jgi:type III pantothenate kinase
MAAPQFLLLDAGNTRLKWATASARGKITPRGEMPAGEVTTATVAKLARRFPGHRAVLACVVPKLTPFFRHAFAGRLVVVTGAARSPLLPFAYPRPAELGADRIAAAVAAHADGKWPAIIVSCGTAVAVTVLDARGRLCGGAIAPGLQTQLAALIGAAAQLPATSLHLSPRLPARSTQDAIRTGVLLNFQGGIKEIVTRLAASLPGNAKPRLLLTGGDVHFLKGVLGPRAQVRPLLVAEGLRIIGLRIFASQT